jgi:hypothetical protein
LEDAELFHIMGYSVILQKEQRDKEINAEPLNTDVTIMLPDDTGRMV